MRSYKHRLNNKPYNFLGVLQFSRQAIHITYIRSIEPEGSLDRIIEEGRLLSLLEDALCMQRAEKGDYL